MVNECMVAAQNNTQKCMVLVTGRLHSASMYSIQMNWMCGWCPNWLRPIYHFWIQEWKDKALGPGSVPSNWKITGSILSWNNSHYALEKLRKEHRGPLWGCSRRLPKEGHSDWKGQMKRSQAEMESIFPTKGKGFQKQQVWASMTVSQERVFLHSHYWWRRKLME